MWKEVPGQQDNRSGGPLWPGKPDPVVVNGMRDGGR